MPRITRKQQKVFAENANNNGVFGSLQANDPVYSQDPDAIQGRTAYANGWNDATYSAEQLPPLEEFQSLQYLFSRQIAYLMQDGIPEWNSATTYYKGALVKAIQSDGSFILYASLIDDNTNNLVTDTTKWVITNTSTNFHQGIPNWRADVIYSAGDWVKALNDGTWAIFESKQNNNLNNAITNTSYWEIKPFTSKLPLLWHSWFDHELDDVSWLRADTFSWQDGTVYSDVYDHLVDDYTNGTSTTETVGSYTITYVLADDGHKITTDETNVANIYNESGVAWYYVLDTANTRFKLPRENPAREELIQVVRAKGNGTALGLTDGTYSGGLVLGSNSPDAYTGSYGANIGTTYSGSAIRTGKASGVTTDPTKSGIISDMTESTSVYKGKKYLYFYVGQYSQSATEQTAGLNAELFNGKLDLDVGNATSGTKETIVGWGMPDISSGISKTRGTIYQAETNGWINVYGKGDSSHTTVNLRYSLNSDMSNEFSPVSNFSTSGTTELKFFVPCPKGVYYQLNTSSITGFITFYPCKGEV